MVSAAGNEGVDLNGRLQSIPAQSGNEIAISATGPGGLQNFDRLASYSNFGASVIDFAAPGGDFVDDANFPFDMALAPAGGSFLEGRCNTRAGSAFPSVTVRGRRAADRSNAMENATGADGDYRSRAAWVAGLAYLLAIPPALFDEFFITGKLVTSSAAETAANLLAHERLFRVGIAGNVFVFAIDAVLIVALFLVLERVHRGLALVAVAWGIIETTLLAVSALSDLEALRLLSGSPILSGLATPTLYSLARSALRGHATAYSLGLVFSGLRGTAFGVLWFRSGLIPKALAVWAILASALLGAWTFAFIAFPELHGGLSVVLFGAPILLFELTMGIWLLVTNRAAVTAR